MRILRFNESKKTKKEELDGISTFDVKSLEPTKDDLVGFVSDYDEVKDKDIKKVNKLSTRHGMEEQETEEGNAFTGALSQARKTGKKDFEVDGKKFETKEAEKIDKKGTSTIEVRNYFVTTNFSDQKYSFKESEVFKDKALFNKKLEGKKDSHFNLDFLCDEFNIPKHDRHTHRIYIT